MMEASSRAIAASTPPLPYSYAPLPQDEDDREASTRTPRWRGACAFLLVAAGVVLLVVAMGLAGVRMEMDHRQAGGAATPVTTREEPAAATSRGREAGVSEKTSGRLGIILGGAAEEEAVGFPWNNAMLQWQRTGFHFQPQKNWMNGPVYYRGWYHLFYQYNPEAAVWGTIAWGHAVSRDLVHWHHLPPAMLPDHWYDANGVWTGSATLLPDGRLAMLYTGSTNASVQVQCLAFPADPNDSLLRDWTKFEGNPVLYPPPGVGLKDFRDPTSAWLDPSDNTWRIVIGSKDDADHAGIAIMYKTKDFVDYELVPGLLHRVPATGLWECIDFYPVGVTGDLADNGLDMSEAMAARASSSSSSSNRTKDVVLHVIKASMDDDRHDYPALGRYDAATNAWTPLDPEKDVGVGPRYDWGKLYASKTFYDPAKRRRVLWGWVGETDSERADVAKGWASLQAIPWMVLLDTKTGSNLLQWPVEEVETLRTNSTDLSGVAVAPGSVLPLSLRRATQLDILAEFEIDSHAVHDDVADDDAGYDCSTAGGAAGRGALGPFGLLVLADTRRAGQGERTAVYFYVSKGGAGADGRPRAHLCHDESRSSRANDIAKRVVGGAVAVLEGESLSVRVLVDHSIVESFAMGGRSAVTSRVYPTEAIYGAAGVYLFNNATAGSVTARKLVVHEMDSSYNQAFMADL